MACSRADIDQWFDIGIKEKAIYMIIVCDTFDWDDYPVYVYRSEDFYPIYNQYTDGQNMQRIMEVYDLSKSKESQMSGRVMNLP